ncbi:MAG: glycosyltransferase [Candidatus Eremiobacteraeota bacterium]|nr:glycosyltransferase [Candidatus Eremiobacteraeota bacterium]
MIVPVFNEQGRLPAVLESIRRQRYPSELVEVLVADGGSTDQTVAIANAFGARVFDNPMRRAEPGVGALLAHARGDVAIIMAADNALVGETTLERLALPFADPQIVAAFPALVSTARDGATTRYFNAFTDPFNHFVYGRAASPASFHRAYRIKRRTSDYVVYDFTGGPMPLVALAQGFAIRLPYQKPPGTEEDDVAPVELLIAQGRDIAFVPSAGVEHHTVDGLSDALRKFGPRIRARLTDADQPVWGRLRAGDRARRIRAHLWPFYSVSVIVPAIGAIYGLARDRRPEWIFHPILSAAFGFEFWRQATIVAFERIRKLRHAD